MDEALSERESAAALAPLLEVILRDGSVRAATADDVIELTSSASPRYVLRDASGRYVADDGKGWTELQREALVIPDRDVARAAAKRGRRFGAVTRVVRIRRRGTCGIEAVRLRPDIKATVEDGRIELAVKPADAMALLAVMRGAKGGDGVQ